MNDQIWDPWEWEDKFVDKKVRQAKILEKLQATNKYKIHISVNYKDYSLPSKKSIRQAQTNDPWN